MRVRHYRIHSTRKKKIGCRIIFTYNKIDACLVIVCFTRGNSGSVLVHVGLRDGSLFR